MGSLWLPAALVLLVSGIFLAAVGTTYRSDSSRAASVAVFAGAWLLELLAIVRQAQGVGSLPITNLGQFLLMLSWAILTSHLVVWLRWRVQALGLVLPPIAALAAFGSLGLLPAAAATPQAGRGGWFLFHTASATVGLAILTVAFGMAVIYLVLDRLLKSKRRLNVLERLPSLDSCDRIGLLALSLGFLLLSLGIATGVVVNTNLHQRLISAELKQTSPLLAWGVFAVVLFSRSILGLRGRKSAYLTIAGFAFGLLTVLGISF